MSSPVWTTSSARPSTKLQKKKSSRFIVKQSPKTIRNKSLLISSQSYPALMTQSTFSFYNPFQKTLEYLSGKPWLHLNFSSPKHFIHLFKSHFGTPYGHYIDQRVRKCRLHIFYLIMKIISALAVRHVLHLLRLGCEWSENYWKSDWFYIIVLKMSHDHSWSLKWP